MTKQFKRRLAGAMSLALALSCASQSVLAATAVVPISDGRKPTCDEAYYATVDYYGNLTEGSIVKSYVLNGATAITDYGEYDSVTNLTDSTAASTGARQVAFDFAGAVSVPTHFYFQGETAQPFRDLPWTLSISYKLNGVPARAEELAGKTGVVEINVDAIPNKDVNHYVRHNYTLEAMALFNQDDILSLEAPGAQVQLLGNLRAVLFLAFPGEEGHYSIRVGADKFEFGGMTFLMVPATLSQLDQISRLAQRKEDLENNYKKLSGSLDELLDALDAVSGSLYASAGGLDALNAARGTFSDGKGTVYEAADQALADLDATTEKLTTLNGSFEALSGEIAVAREAVSETSDTVRALTTQTVALRESLEQLKKNLNAISGNKSDLLRVINDLDGMQDTLKKLSRELTNASFHPVMSYSSAESTVQGFSSANTLYQAYQNTADAATFMATALVIGGQAADATEAAAKLTQMQTVHASFPDAATALAVGGEDYAAAWSGYDALVAAATAYLTGAKTFPDFLAALKTLAPARAEELDKLAALYGDDPGAMEFLMDSSQDLANSTREIESNVSRSIGAANSLVSALTAPTATLADELKVLCDHIGELDDLIESADNIVTVTAKDTDKIRAVLDEVDALQKTLDKYEPETLRALDELNTVSNDLSAAGAEATTAMTDTSAFLKSAEELMQNAGTQLDAATRQSLSSLAASLRSTAAALGKNGGVRSAKETITDMIEDTWNDYTGDVNDLLEIDVDAEIVSLTDVRNPSPTSVQVLIRTQEIKVEAPQAETLAVKTAAETARTTFWDRVCAMFVGMWGAIVSVFHRG